MIQFPLLEFDAHEADYNHIRLLLRFYQFVPMDSEQTITVVFLGMIGGIALGEALRLWLKLRSVNTQIENASRKVAAGKALAGDVLQESWSRYRATFLASSGDREKTDARAADYFSESDVLTGTLNLRYWLSVPGALVGLGILGTFVGLAFGISDLNADTSEQIRDGMNRLLDGMSMAFSTSIAGMAASILFGIWEKNQFRRVSNKLRELCSRLDSRFQVNTVDRHRFAQEDQLKLFGSLFGYEAENGPVGPGTILRAIRHESEQQTIALKQFSTDLADGITLSTMTIEALGVNLKSAFDEAMRTTLAPALEDVRGAVDRLQQEKAGTNEALVEDVVSKLEASLEKMGEQFQHALSGGALSQLEAVVQSMGETHGALANLPDTVRDLMDQMRSSLSESNGEVSQAASDTSQRLRAESEHAIETFGQAIKALQVRTQSLLDQQGETTASATHLTERVREMIGMLGTAAGQLSASTKGVQNTLADFQRLSSSLDSSALTLSQSTNILKTTTSAFGVSSQGWMEANRGNLEALREALEESRRVGADYADRFGVIEGGLKNVFGELQDGLGTYQSSTRAALESYLKQFTENLTIAANALSGSVGALDESLQDLVDIVESASRSRTNGHPHP